jgi:hypothetical protein
MLNGCFNTTLFHFFVSSVHFDFSVAITFHPVCPNYKFLLAFFAPRHPHMIVGPLNLYTCSSICALVPLGFPDSIINLWEFLPIARFVFLRAVLVKIQIFWDIMLWQLVNCLANMYNKHINAHLFDSLLYCSIFVAPTWVHVGPS